MANLQSWFEKARHHWKQRLSKMHKELKESGKLNLALRKAADQTLGDGAADGSRTPALGGVKMIR